MEVNDEMNCELNDEDLEMDDIEYIEGVMCRYLCMAEWATGTTASTGQEKDENGPYKLKKGITSDSGAEDTVGPDYEFPDYPTEESPGSKRGLHDLAAGGQKSRTPGRNES